MADPVRLDLSARRNETWAPTIDLPYPGQQLPLANATIAMQLRAFPGASDAILTVKPVPFTDALVAGTAGGADEQRVLTLSPSADLTTITASQPASGGAQVFDHDVRVTYADGVSEVLAAGEFTLQPGVTTV